jgi:hypothetical protein
MAHVMAVDGYEATAGTFADPVRLAPSNGPAPFCRRTMHQSANANGINDSGEACFYFYPAGTNSATMLTPRIVHWRPNWRAPDDDDAQMTLKFKEEAREQISGTIAEHIKRSCNIWALGLLLRAWNIHLYGQLSLDTECKKALKETEYRKSRSIGVPLQINNVT